MLHPKLVFYPRPGALLYPPTLCCAKVKSTWHLNNAVVCAAELHQHLFLFLIRFDERPFGWSVIPPWLPSCNQFSIAGQLLLFYYFVSPSLERTSVVLLTKFFSYPSWIQEVGQLPRTLFLRHRYFGLSILPGTLILLVFPKTYNLFLFFLTSRSIGWILLGCSTHTFQLSVCFDYALYFFHSKSRCVIESETSGRIQGLFG